MLADGVPRVASSACRHDVSPGIGALDLQGFHSPGEAILSGEAA